MGWEPKFCRGRGSKKWGILPYPKRGGESITLVRANAWQLCNVLKRSIGGTFGEATGNAKQESRFEMSWISHCSGLPNKPMVHVSMYLLIYILTYIDLSTSFYLFFIYLSTYLPIHIFSTFQLCTFLSIDVP